MGVQSISSMYNKNGLNENTFTSTNKYLINNVNTTNKIHLNQLQKGNSNTKKQSQIQPKINSNHFKYFEGISNTSTDLFKKQEELSFLGYLNNSKINNSTNYKQIFKQQKKENSPVSYDKKFFNNIYNGFNWNIDKYKKAWYQSNEKGNHFVVSMATLYAKHNSPDKMNNSITPSPFAHIKQFKDLVQKKQEDFLQNSFPKGNLNPDRNIPNIQSNPTYTFYKKFNKKASSLPFSQSGYRIIRIDKNKNNMNRIIRHKLNPKRFISYKSMENLKPFDFSSCLDFQKSISSKPVSFKNFNSTMK